MWPSLLIFALILGNFMQLQVGLGGGQELISRMSAAMVQLTQLRTPWVWVTGWLFHGIWSYLFLSVASAWALTLIWKRTERLTRWVLVGLSVSGLLSVAVAIGLLHARVHLAVEMQPARNLAFSVALAVLLCGAAAAHTRKWPWTVLVLAAVLNPQVLDLLHGRLALTRRAPSSPEVAELAGWAERSTWGSSLFQFPDAGRSNEPGIFRALSRRALWADWQSGLIADDSDPAGQEWWSRWQDTMEGGYYAGRVQNMLPLPVDYFVLTREHVLSGVKPAFANSRFVVYDAQDLREFRGGIR
jgi:hypothetical protein